MASKISVSRLVGGVSFVFLLAGGLCPAQTERVDLAEGLHLEARNVRTTLDRTTRELITSIDVVLWNTHAPTVLSPLHLVVDPGTDQATVRDAMGGPADPTYGSFYFNIAPNLSNGLLRAGGSTTTHVEIVRDSDVTLHYALSAFGKFNGNPLARSGAPYSSRLDEPVLFDASGSVDPDGHSLTYAWDLGDGTTAAGATPMHTYSAPGVYHVVLTLEDGVGGMTQADISVSVLPSNTFALARTRSLDEVGHPLPDVIVEESGPSGVMDYETDVTSGFVTLGQGPGAHTWKFSKDGYMPAWRAQVLVAEEVLVVPNPRLVAQPDEVTVVSPIQGTVVSNRAGRMSMAFEAGAFAQFTDARLSQLSGQTLPAPLPPGWSPIQAFWLDLSNGPLADGMLTMTLDESLENGETGVFTRWDPAQMAWTVLATPVGDGGDVVTLPLPGSGMYAFVVGDTGPTAPPAAQAAQSLEGTPVVGPDLNTVTAEGTVDPVASAASLVPAEVTAQATVRFTATEPLPSGIMLRSVVRETYDLQDGTVQRTPDYEAFITAYHRPGHVDANTVQARFPLHPQILYPGDRLTQATLDVDILAPEGFSGGVVDESGGVVQGADVQLIIDAGDLSGLQAVEIRALDPASFTEFPGGGGTIAQAFALQLDGLTESNRLDVLFGPRQPNTDYVLALVTTVGGQRGLVPVERFQSDASAILQSVEPAAGQRLPGVTGPGQYVLVQVSGPQGLVTGTARDESAQSSAGLELRVADAPWVDISDVAGQYILIAPAGDVEIFALDPDTGNAGTANGNIADPGIPITIDVAVAITGPFIVMTEPQADANGVRSVTDVSIFFSEAILPDTFLADGVLLLDEEGAEVDGALFLSLDQQVGTFFPVNPLEPDRVYTVAVASAISDLQGLPIEGPLQFMFTTESPARRGAGAALTIYEPGATNCPCKGLPGFDAADPSIICMQGSQGSADSGVPVILVNETSGETATVLSDPDGSFIGFVNGEEEDFISAVFVNANDTRITIPATRQLFDNGFVGLYQAGGILEAESDGGPVQVLIEPGAIASRTKFKFDVIGLTELLALVNGTQPEDGQILGGFRLGMEGDALEESADISFPIDEAALNLGPDETSDDRTFALCEPIEVDGETLYSVVDKMEYADGELVTRSPPFEGIGSTSAALGVFMPIMLAFGNQVVLNGKVATLGESAGIPTEDEILAGATAADVPIVPLPGAIVSAADGVTDVSLRLRPGGIVSRANSRGFYALMYPFNGLSPGPVLVRAQHFRFPGNIGSTVITPPHIGFGPIPIAVANVLIRVPDGSDADTLPPIITVETPSAVLPLNSDVVIDLIMRDNLSLPTLQSFVLSTNASVSLVPGVDFSSSDVTNTEGTSQTLSATRRKVPITLHATNAVIAAYDVKAVDAAGNVRETALRFRFGVAPEESTNDLVAVDGGDILGPQVLSTVPGDGHEIGDRQVVLYFSEPIKGKIENDGAVTVSPDVPFDSKLVSDQRVLLLNFSRLEPDTDYTLTLTSGNAEDLSGNALQGGTYSTTFRTPEFLEADLGDVTQAAGSVIHGNLSFQLARDDGGKLVVHRLGDTEDVASVGSINLPPYPRTLTVIPRYSYTDAPTGGSVSTNRLLVAATGGLVGEGQVGPWLWLIDVTDPENPTRLAGTLVSIDGSSIANILRWDPPYLALALNTSEGGQISYVNVQALILGEKGFTEVAYQRGADLNADGDYVDPNEQPPVPERNTLFGQEFGFPLTARFITDFDTRASGTFLVSALSQRGTVPSRLQVVTFQGQLIGLGDDDKGSVEMTTGEIRRVLLDLNFPVTDDTGIKAVPVAIASVDNNIHVYDLTDAESPELIREVELEADSGNILALVRSADAELVAGTSKGLYIIDVLALGSHTNFENSVTHVIPGAVAGRAQGASDLAFSLTSGGTVRMINRPPIIRVVQVPTLDVTSGSDLVDSDETNRIAYLEASVESPFLMPLMPIDCDQLVTNSDVRPLSPPDPLFHHYVRVRASGAFGDTLTLAAESLTQGGHLYTPKGDEFPAVLLTDKATLVGLDKNHPDVSALTVYRLSDDESTDLYNDYMSSPFVLALQSLTPEQTNVIDDVDGRQVLLSGNFLRVGIDIVPNPDPDLEPYIAEADTGVLLPGRHKTYLGLPAEYFESPNPSAPRASPIFAGVDAQNGEFYQPEVDIIVEGRHQDLILQRAYASRSCYVGAWGRGWDHNYNARLMELPEAYLPPGLRIPKLNLGDRCVESTPGDVLFMDGVGGVHLFRKIAAHNGNESEQSFYEDDPALDEFLGLNGSDEILTYYESPPGIYSALYKLNDTRFMLVGQVGNRMMFEPGGRLDRIIGVYEESVVQLHYRDDGLLDEVEGDRGIRLEFGYYFPFLSPRRKGLVDGVSDESYLMGKVYQVKSDSSLINKQKVEYEYDDTGNLWKVKPVIGDETVYTHDTARPYLMTRIGDGDGTEMPGMEIKYNSTGLVESVTWAKTETISFTGAVVTAKERFDMNGGELHVAQAVIKVDERGHPTELANRTFEADEKGQPVVVENVDNHVSMTYDASNTVYRFRGNLTRTERRAIDGDQVFISSMVYDGSAFNRIQTITNIAGNVTAFTFSGNDVTEKKGPVTHKFINNDYGQTTKEELSESGSPTFIITHTYGMSGLLTPEAGLETERTFATKATKDRDLYGRLEKFGDRGTTYTLTYDDNSSIEEQDADDVLYPDVTYTYDDTLRLEEEKTRFGMDPVSLQLNRTYDMTHPGLVKTLKTKEEGLQDSTTTYGYTDEGQVETVDVDGAVTTLTYDGLRVLMLEGPGVLREVEYEAAGQQVSRIVEQGVQADLEYDDQGRLEKTTRQGAETSLSYDDADAPGLSDRLASRVVKDASTQQELLREDFAYDDAGRVESNTGIGGRKREYDYFPDGSIRRMKIDGVVAQTTTRDPRGRITEQVINQLKNVYSQFDTDTAVPKREVVSFLNGSGTVTIDKTYDSIGRLKDVKMPIGTWNYAYDGFGQVTERKDPDGVVVRQWFTPSGHVLSNQFADGTTAKFRYDIHRRLTNITSTAGGIEFGHDADGLVDSITYPDGVNDSFTDRNNFFEPDTVTRGADAQTHTWNSDGRLERIEISATSDTLDYEYDALGRQTNARFNAESASIGHNVYGDFASEVTWAGTWSMDLNSRGHVLSETYPSGLFLDYQPDSYGQPLGLGPAGVSSITWKAPALADTVSYGAGRLEVRRKYDANLRLTNIEYRVGAGPQAPTTAAFRYKLTDGGRILSEERDHQSETDLYQRNTAQEGMRIERFVFGATNASGQGAVAHVSDLTFDLGEIKSSANQSNPDLTGPDIRGFFPELIWSGVQLQQMDGQPVQYDDCGSATKFPTWVRLPGDLALTRVQATATYDGLGMLRSVARDDGVTVTYRRDGFGRIVERTSSGPTNRCEAGTTSYAWKGQQLIEEYQDDSFGQPQLTHRYLYLGADLVTVQVQTDGNFSSYVPLVTMNGSIAGFADPAGDLIETIRYTAYGYPSFTLHASGDDEAKGRSVVANSLFFQGAWFDECTGIYQFGQRNLHPLAGLFLQRDNALFTESLALFTAFNGDPIGRLDPVGLVSGIPVGTAAKNLKDIFKTVSEARKGARELGEQISKDGGSLSFDVASKGSNLLKIPVDMAARLSDGDTKKRAEAISAGLDAFKNGADTLKSLNSMRKDRSLLSAIETVTAGGGLGTRSGMQWLSREGASGSMSTLANLSRKYADNDEFNKAASLQRGSYAATSYYRDQRSTIKDRRGDNLLGVGKGLSALSKAYRQKYLADKDGNPTSPRLHQGALAGEKIIDAVDKTRTLINSKEMSRLRKARGLKNADALWHLTGKGSLSAVQASYTAGFEVGKLLILMASDEETGKAYTEMAKQFEKDGGYLTVAGGILATFGADDAAFAIQQYQDFSLTDALGQMSEQMQQERAKQAARRNQYLRGISAP